MGHPHPPQPAASDRPYNEEEDVTEDEGQAVIKLPVRKPRAKRAPKPQQPETAEEDEDEDVRHVMVG